MSDENEQTEGESSETADGDVQLAAASDASADAETDPEIAREPMPPIESRFLYVDVAGQRAKQLRRGALPKLKGLAPDPETGVRPELPHKLERIAMEEVDGGLIVYELPERKTPAQDES